MDELNNKQDHFQQERRSSRVLMLQYMYRCDSQQSWCADEQTMADFFELAVETDTMLPPASLKNAVRRAKKLLPQLCGKIAELDGLICQASSNWALNRLDRLDHNLIRLAAFEFLHVSGVSPAIAINEAVELAKLYGQADSAAFINGVLDKIRLLNAEKLS